MPGLLDDLRQILEEILTKQKVGTLTLGRRKRQRELFFEPGAVYLLNRGNLHKIVLSRELKSHPGMTDAVLRQAVQEALQSDQTLPDVLLHCHGVSQELYERLLTIQVTEEMLDAIFTCRGSMLFQDGLVPEDLLDHEGYAAKVCLKQEDFIAAVRERQKLLAQIELVLPSTAEVCVVTEKGLAMRNQPQGFAFETILDLVDGLRTLARIVQDSPFYEVYVLAQIVTFLQNGLVKKTIFPELRGVDATRLSAADAQRHLQHFEQAVRFAADELNARERLALVYETLGRTNDALAQYDLIAQSFLRAGKNDKAIKIYLRGMQADPSNAAFREKICTIYTSEVEQFLAAGDHARALALLEQARELFPQCGDLYCSQVAVAQQSGNRDHVRTVFEQALDHGKKTSDWNPALLLVERFDAFFRQDPALNSKIANLLLDMGRTDEALARMAAIARGHIECGDTHSALDVYKKMQRLAPDRGDIRRAMRSLDTVKRERKPLPVRTAVLALFVIALGYQAYSFLRFREIAHAVTPDRQPEAYEEFMALHPVSVCRFWARAHLARAREARTAAALAEARQLEKLMSQAQFAEEMGDLDRARRLYHAIADQPGPAHAAAARERLYELTRRDHEAEDLLSSALKKDIEGAHEESFLLMRTLVTEYGATEAARKAVFPILIASHPPGAALRIDGEIKGVTPLRVKVPVYERPTFVLHLDHHAPRTIAIKPDEKPEVMVTLYREHAWFSKLPAATRQEPLLHLDRLFMAGADGTLRSFDPRDGRLLREWAIKDATDITDGPLAVGDLVIFSTNNGRICVVDRTNAISEWRAGHLIRTALLPGGQGAVCFGTSERKVRKLSLTTGKVVWEVSLPHECAHQAVTSGDALVFTCAENEIHALAQDSGALIWTARIRPGASLDAWGAMVLVRSGATLTVMRADNGSTLWTQTLAKPIASTFLWGPDLWVSFTDGELACFHSGTGEKSSTVRLEGAVTHWTLLSSLLVVALDRNEILALDPEKLKREWAYAPTGPVKAMSNVAGALVLVSEDQGLYCVVER